MGIAELRTVTALVTPFRNGAVEHSLLNEAVDRQVRTGIDGIVVCDIFGEGHALARDERDHLLSACLERAAGRLAVFAATGTNNTAETVALTRRAAEIGADGVLVTVPYYSKPTLRGVIGHFREVAGATRLPVILDDDPHRTALDCGQALLSSLTDIQNIVGVRHGIGRLEAFHRLPADLRRRYRHYSSDDSTLPMFLACGGHGWISALGNVFPYRLAAMTPVAASAGDLSFRQAQSLLVAAEGRWDAAVVKAATAILYETPSEVRLPLVEVEPQVSEAIAHALAALEGQPVFSRALA
ncbi:hypothetical protein LCM4573_15605 [Rhizobium sp. LCM 4573]|nr:hypothetical protein LCM4573_15605 [Rhizobium sp. LCM 4573]